MSTGHNFSLRVRVICSFFLAATALCIAQLFQLQIVHGADYAEEALREYVQTSDAMFDRGTVYFTQAPGELMPAATIRPAFSLILNPSKIGDRESTYTKLAAIINLDRSKFLSQATKPNDVYEIAADDIDARKAPKISALNLAGVSVVEQKKRFYPAANLAAHLLGFVGWGVDEAGKQVLAGRYGLERFYNDVLERTSTGLYVNFFAEVFDNLQNLRTREGSLAGDIVTSIEPTVQATLEKELQQTQAEWDGESLGGIVMDPVTGRIFAMAALPNYNPNNFNTVSDHSLFANPLVEHVYEMGSIVKPLAMAAAINAGKVTASTTYNDFLGHVTVDHAVISNYDGKGRGARISMQEVLNQSLNTGMVFVMERMGRQLFSTAMKSYGIGEKTGVDLPNETSGLVQNLDSPRDVEHATAAFGQGIAMTPLEVTRALATLANGGYLVRPTVVDEVRYTMGLSDHTTHLRGAQVIKPETSKAITDMLVRVVDTALVHGAAKMDHYTIAAKTGTAQISKPGGHGYYDDRFAHTFFGYFPAYHPRFIIMLYMIHPRRAQFASATLTAPFMNLTKFLLNYYKIPPDR